MKSVQGDLGINRRQCAKGKSYCARAPSHPVLKNDCDYISRTSCSSLNSCCCVTVVHGSGHVMKVLGVQFIALQCPVFGCLAWGELGLCVQSFSAAVPCVGVTGLGGGLGFAVRSCSLHVPTSGLATLASGGGSSRFPQTEPLIACFLVGVL